MTHIELTSSLLGAAWLAAGALIGAAHFLTLRWNVRMLATGRSVLLPLGVQLARFALMAAVLLLITRSFGAWPLLMATVGILVARTAILRLGVPS